MLAALAAQLQQSLSLQQKQDIQIAAKALLRFSVENEFINAFLGAPPLCGFDIKTAMSPYSNKSESKIRLGDDCAAIPDGDGYLLLAAEGMLPEFLENEPWFAGWSAIMVNASDIYAMGGRPIAVVNTIWSQYQDSTNRSWIDKIWAGMNAASQAYQIPIVGGHSNCHSNFNALSVAILGRAQKLISSFSAQPGDRLLLAADFRGKSHPIYPFWDAATTAPPDRLRNNLGILPYLAETGLCNTGKDISNGGLIGTVLMLLETSNCGAVLDLDQIPHPDSLSLDRWLISFPSYGFLLSVSADRLAAVRDCFRQHDLICEIIGEIEMGTKLTLRSQQEEVLFWDLEQQPLTGFGGVRP